MNDAKPEPATARRLALSLLALVVLLAPAAIALLWHLNNGAWPRDDAANYMDTAYGHYLALTNGTLEDGLRSIYRDRGWRPIFFPVLAVPFLWLSGGDVLAAAAGVLVGCTLAWSIYAYGIARQYLTPLAAAIAAAFACTSPRLPGTTIAFFAEAAWLAACTAFIYHALRSEDFRNRWHALGAGIALAMAVLLRPAESAAVMALPVIILLAFALRRGTIGKRDLTIATLQVGITVVALSAAALSPYLDHEKIWLLSAALVAAGFYATQRQPGSLGLALCVAAVVALNAWWWADFMPRLFSWVYTTSFGTMARITDVRASELGLAGLLGWLGQRYVSVQTLLVVGLATIVATAGLARKRTAPFPLPLVLVALGTLVPMLVLYGLTGTSDLRRLLGGAFFTVLAAAIVAMGDGPMRRARIALVGAVAVAQLILFLDVARSDTATLQALSPWVRSDGLSLPRRQADLNQAFVNQILKAGVPRRSNVAIYTMALHNQRFRIWEPAAAMLATRTLRVPIHLTYTWELGDYEKALAFYRANGVEYIVIERFRDPENPASHQPYIQFIVALLDHIDAAPTDPPGLKLLGRFELGGRENRVYRIVPG